MRTAAICDIHGNLPALEAVLDAMRRAEVGQVVVVGDVAPGPMSVECLSALRSLDVPTYFVRGNTDRELTAHYRGVETEWFASAGEDWRAQVRWTAERTDPTAVEFIESWPLTVSLAVDGLGQVLFAHATPRDDDEIFTKQTAAEVLEKVFVQSEDTFVCGHTHMQFDIRVGEKRIVNAGSVGMPFGPQTACWALLGPDVLLVQTPYDLDAAASRMRKTGYPGVEGFVQRFVLDTPSEESMLELYRQYELKP
ncbi:MAG TPA: metallophosphoesterase family protein [Fimbriimonadaceae bacterium]|nr:metallophosphoesterase family protein [Fimbriimonadaceae bacterium]